MCAKKKTTEYKRRSASPAILEQYLDGIAKGNSKAMEELYHATSAEIYSYALVVLKNANDAQDVLQDTYLSVYKGIATYRNEGKPMAWIMTVVRNLCMKKLHQRHRNPQLTDEEWEAYVGETGGLSLEENVVVRECLTRLSDQERQVVVLHVVSGFRHREIAEMLGLPISTVLSKYNRAIKKLKQYL